MPRLNDVTMENNLGTGTFGFSGVKIENLGAAEYTLVTIVQDVSTSVGGFKKQMENCLEEIVKSCRHSPRGDNLLIRFLEFGSNLEEVHGFKLLENCHDGDYKGVLKINGCTALYDATEEAVKATGNYAKDLRDNDFDVNAIVFVITDGEDNNSTGTAKGIKKALDDLKREETLESLVTVLIGVGAVDNSSLANCLKHFKTRAGLDQYIELPNANAAGLAKLADFVSKSIGAQSQALGTGGPSQPVAFTF